MCVKQDILAAVAYFDIFDYPVTQTEISQFLRATHSSDEIITGLHNLTTENWIYKFDEFYTLQDNYSLVIRRRKGNAKARAMLKTAEKIAAFLSGFPFVRGVAVSGSLSKNFADENSDIDFFIITAKNKLWLARTFMHCFKKLTFLAKKQSWFCMNYYVDEEVLQIREKNIFTATEVATLLPLRGINAFQNFYAANRWTRDFLPNHTMRVSYVEESKGSLVKKLVELLLSNPIGNLLDYFFMKWTSARWNKKTRSRKLNSRGIIMSMDTSRHYAKPGSENFQKSLIEIYEKKIASLFRRYENKIQTMTNLD